MPCDTGMGGVFNGLDCIDCDCSAYVERHGLAQGRIACAPRPTFFPQRRPPATRPAAGLLSVGIELECEIPREHFEAVEAWVEGFDRPACDIHTDGSIATERSGSIARELTFWSTDMAEIESYIRTMYETFGAHTNTSMGFHIHIKPEPRLTWAFATRGYWEGFYGAYRAYAAEADDRNRRGRGKFAERMGNSWCRMTPYNLDYVVSASTDEGRVSRYVAVNLESLVKHEFGTIEHRIMPHQSDAEEAIRSVRWLVDTASSLINGPLVYESMRLQTPFEIPQSIEARVSDYAPVNLSETVIDPTGTVSREVELIYHPRLVATEEV